MVFKQFQSCNVKFCTVSWCIIKKKQARVHFLIILFYLRVTAEKIILFIIIVSLFENYILFKFTPFINLFFKFWMKPMVYWYTSKLIFKKFYIFSGRSILSLKLSLNFNNMKCQKIGSIWPLQSTKLNGVCLLMASCSEQFGLCGSTVTITLEGDAN